MNSLNMLKQFLIKFDKELGVLSKGTCLQIKFFITDKGVLDINEVSVDEHTIRTVIDFRSFLKELFREYPQFTQGVHFYSTTKLEIFLTKENQGGPKQIRINKHLFKETRAKFHVTFDISAAKLTVDQTNTIDNLINGLEL